MPNGHEKKQYGGHDYGNSEGTSNCKFGCGCWMGPFRSDGPIGLDPFGRCPNNPADGVRRSGNIDYEDVVKQRIADLQTKLSQAETKLEQVKPSKKALATNLTVTRGELAEAKIRLSQIAELASI